jgi:hypothetical protein
VIVRAALPQPRASPLDWHSQRRMRRFIGAAHAPQTSSRELAQPYPRLLASTSGWTSRAEDCVRPGGGAAARLDHQADVEIKGIAFVQAAAWKNTSPLSLTIQGERGLGVRVSRAYFAVMMK